MPDDNSADLTLSYRRCGMNGKATVTARLGGEVLDVQKLDVTRPKDRMAFAEKVARDRPGINAADIERELLSIAAELAAQEHAHDDAAVADLPEVDVSAIVRPERIITPDVSAVAVPAWFGSDDRITGRWHLYLRWSDGRRERQPLSDTVELPSGKRLWVFPEPPPLTSPIEAAWSKEARQRWLAGDPAPDPADVFPRLCEAIASYIDFPEGEGPGMIGTLACWAILTYAYHAWPAVPYLAMIGPPGSGKTRVLDVLSRVAFAPYTSSNATAAAIFRTLHARGGTLFLDEAERLKNTQDPAAAETLSILLAGYRRGGRASRLEPLPDGRFKTVEFDVFGPKALACVAGLPPALASRCIRLTMLRAPRDSGRAHKRLDADPGKWQALRDDLHALALEHGATWLALPERSDVCPPMAGRDQELWQPLLAIAAWVEEAGCRGLLKLLQDHAAAVIDTNKDDQLAEADEVLLRALAARLKQGDTPQPSAILTDALEAEPHLFRRWTAKGASDALARFGIRTRKLHGVKVYRPDCIDALRRIQKVYGMSLGLADDEG